MKYSKEILPNGITLLKVPVSDSESVVVNFFVKTGSRNEEARYRGVSHFLEHLLFKGTKKYPNARVLSSTVEAIGAEYNAATSKEYTVFYIKAAAEHLPLIFDVLSEMLRRPLLDETELEREKGVIIEEMNMYRDAPMRYVPDLLEEQMWPDSDFGAQIIGSEKTVRGLTQVNIRDYITSQYVGRNLILAVAGKYKDAELNRLVEKYWSNSPAGSPSVFTPAPVKPKSSLVRLEYKKTEQAHMALGFYGNDFNFADNHVVDVLVNLLGGGMSSRLFSEIRERRGLAYYVHMGAQHCQDTGAVVVSAGLRLNKIEEAVSVTAAELRKIRSQKIPSQELRKAKENMKGRAILALEDSESRLEWYLEQVAFHKKIIKPKEWFRKIESVTPVQIQRMARQLFRPGNFRLALIGPYRGQEKKLGKLLRF